MTETEYVRLGTRRNKPSNFPGQSRIRILEAFEWDVHERYIPRCCSAIYARVRDRERERSETGCVYCTEALKQSA